MGRLVVRFGARRGDRSRAGRTLMWWCASTLLCSAGVLHAQGADKPFVRVSPRDSRYFELSDGRAYIPIGLNMIAPPGGNETKAMARMEDWMHKLSSNGGNYIRLWLSNGFFDVEHSQSGVYDEQKAKRIDAVLAMARKYDLRVKMTLEHFRHLGDGRQAWAAKPVHHASQGGPAKDIVDFFANPASREQFKRKLDWYAKRYGDDPTIFAWELWNEFDAVQEMWKPEAWQPGGVALDWTQVMLDALHQRFPKNMAVQSLGSFDNERKTETYRTFCLIRGNDIAQVHRYLDLGAKLEVCHGPVDVLAADAVQTLLSFDSGKPVVLVESGAVEPGHSGVFKLYGQDKAGIILHDVLFAPFFAGAAGPGQCWHWDSYVAANDLWRHFGYFAKSVRDLDPPAEGFRPVRIDHPRLRVYALAGRNTLIAWCRDKQNTWRTELAEGLQPERLEGQVIDLPADLIPQGNARIRIYDLWADKWSDGRLDHGRLALPPFTRSIVFRIERSPEVRQRDAPHGGPGSDGRVAGILPAIRGQDALDTNDPYLWLEEVRGEKALEWVKARNEATLAVLKAQPMFQETYDKALEILNSNVRIPYPQIRGNYLYNFWQDEKNERGLWRRTTLEEYGKPSPEWEVLLDIDKLCLDEGEQWVFKGAGGLYPDYNLFLVQLSRGGGDAVVVREFDANAKQFVKDGFYLPEAKSDVSWRDRDSLYVGTDFGPGSLTDSGYPRVAKLWKRGTPLSSAETVFEGEAKDVAAGCSAIHTPERQYDVASRSMTFYTSHTYVIESGRPLKLEIPDDADFGGFFKNQLLVRLKTDWTLGQETYRQGALIAIDYDKYLQASRAFSVIAEPNERSNIVSFAGTRNVLLVLLLNNVRSELFAFRLKDGRWAKEKVDAPKLGTLNLVSADERSDRYFLSYQGFLTPTSLHYASDGQAMQKVKTLPHFFDANGLATEQFEATSRDGTKIPYFVVRPRGMKADGTSPTLLYGYGGFEIEMLPSYSAVTGASWLAKGGVYVLANIRGGGEFGPAWHQAALKENRQRAYDDFAAVAEDLIRRKITSPQHLGIMGGSNGGLLMGVEFTQRPELFNGVVCLVPLLDMKRYNKLLAGASWMAEYGDPDVPEEWSYICRYSPYHNVRSDGKYPRVFFYTSTADDRVHPGHARKMAARMEEMGHKVYYYENMEGGHAAAATNKQQALRTALSYSYLWMQLK